MPGLIVPPFPPDSVVGPAPPYPLEGGPPSGAGKLADGITAGNMPKCPMPFGTGVPLARIPRVMNCGEVRPLAWWSIVPLPVDRGDPSVYAGLAR